MKKQKQCDCIRIQATTLEIPLKTTVRHASASRKNGESIWVQACKGNLTGYGEGCPRAYVAGDDLTSSLSWVNKIFCSEPCPITNLNKLIRWVEENKCLIDTYPSAWCAVETALLDLFAREQSISIEALLDLPEARRSSRYSAVLGNEKPWKFKGQADLYFVKGMTDFKVKLCGEFAKDQEKLINLEILANDHRAKNVRIRLDANNLWQEDLTEAVAFIRNLKGNFFAVEEPLKAGHAEALSNFSVETGLPVILDESLCTTQDLEKFRDRPGRFIANIKISRVGGLLRAQSLINTLKSMGWDIIIGCHVGETSLLTRCGLVAAAMAGESLIAHEGAFGSYLLDLEPTFPMLTFSREGSLNLQSPYFLKTIRGLECVTPETWGTGLGMKCRMPVQPDDGAPKIATLTMPDDYPIHYRVWGEDKGEDVILILHGGMSHSGWQAPLAESLRNRRDNITVMAADRRGCGLNPNRGDLGTMHQVIDDVVRHVEYLQTCFERVHLAGWCQGAQYASVAATRLDKKADSLVLLTPGFFWNERFRSVISISEHVMMEMISEFDLKPERNRACIIIPMEPADFTLDEAWLDYIDTDDLKTTKITLKSANIMDEIQELSVFAIKANTCPTLAILADQDRIVDNKKTIEVLGHQFSGSSSNTLEFIDTAHAVQFEKPEEVAEYIDRFLNTI
ncbi:alpha/beta fold hydrolase [Desulfoluna spongiiphila]|uniref:L-alanine-DL-glutamate epimerase n=1 Tax=Desulfoluna spongiiphila TaxID=419481 RepID=A0A1G5G231_9BACT|nr:alpha/beta fold hydrolase [Desulfoluna spongiiphila]SCY45595.1 L-alanine-DL-glutamate epimerase [Desulfoluna spongiiphila]